MTKDDKKVIRNLIIFCVTFSLAFAGYKIYVTLNKPMPYLKPSSHDSSRVQIDDKPLEQAKNGQLVDRSQSSVQKKGSSSNYANDNSHGMDNKKDTIYKKENKNEAINKNANLDKDNVPYKKHKQFGTIANPLDDKEELLLQAVILGNIEEVKRYVGLGANINHCDKSGNTILARALDSWKKSISKEQINALRHILAIGADVNFKNFNGYTPLNKYIADGGENKTVLSILLNNLADINSQNNFGFSPLHEAVDRGNADLVEFLIDHKADKNLLTRSGQTALDIAKNNQNDKIIELLQ